MDANTLTTKSREALSAAVTGAATAGNPEVDPAHLLTAILADPDGAAVGVLAAAGGDPAAAARGAEAILGRLAAARGATTAAPQLGRLALTVLESAAQEAATLSDDYISTEHLLVALAAEGGTDVASLLPSKEALLQAFSAVRGNRRVTSPDPESTYEALAKYGVDLTERARAG
ncbi:MAG TPA: Clp protease N-terminal domain-containing protein, partial [Mycobacteriales bacterium]